MDFGSFKWSESEPNGILTIQITSEGDPAKQVIRAIRFAKKYRCRIIRRVEYHPAMVGGWTDFKVKCDSRTDRSLWDGGRFYNAYAPSGITVTDIKAYKREFRTDRCVQPGFKKEFWYTSNWDGLKIVSATLKEAMKKARKEYGETVAIYTNFPYGRCSEIKCFAPCSGFMPA